ncbi:uncharacterized protein SAPINGB_P005058 [Magnusiomyces paraingens]|uniref:Eukaryotic translation initiation factor 3 subunit C n=1 Tax=Magnusiomyces paraingens TaxID=2606893 RepID=A0A5E8C3R9_9ASCO|nr:uncharacterized protein SAPINGB_P005058 [Saprochaete ingens]VVT56438.1 unnamed protein product [Saprochaete ingens]
MSRFFQQLSSSESDSSEEEKYESSSEEESSEEESSEEESEEESDEDESDSESDSDSEKGGNKASSFLKSKSKFLKGAESDSESESEDESKRVVKSAKDKLLDEIDTIIKAIDNAKKINDWNAISTDFDKLIKSVEKVTKQFGITPKQYVKAVADLEDFAIETTKTQKASKKKMNASNTKAHSSTTQKVKKNNRTIEKLISSYRADPEAFLSAPEAAGTTLVQPKNIKITTSFNVPSTQAEDDDSGFTTVGKLSGDAFATLISIVESRGKKGVDKEKQVSELESLLKSTQDTYLQIIILLRLIPIKFDLAPSGHAAPINVWNEARDYTTQLLDILENNASKYQLSDSAPEPEDLEKGLPPREDGVQEIPGSIVSLVERLDDEFTRSLLEIDPHTTEYVDRLRDENSLYTLIIRSQIYLENTSKVSVDQYESISRIISRRVDHIYFKPNTAVIAGEKAAWSVLDAKLDSKITPRIQDEVSDEFVIDLVSRLCSILYKQPNTLFRTRAMLCHIYNFALNDMYYKARDLMLMCHLQTNIHGNEIPILILFNRTLIQIGLCAFRKGLIAECQQTLSDVILSPRLKELLGQGVAKASTTTTTEGKQRMLPFHMHINLEFLECINLTASLLIEIPAIAASENQIDGKKVVSRNFRRMLDNSSRQVFTGPPENTRDHIMHAARALLDCEWTKARDLLNTIKIWNLLPKPEEIKAMLAEKLQVEGLRTYLFRYGSTYQSLSFSILSTLFDLPERRVYAIISKMIANEEIDAALDQKTDSVIFRQGVDLSRLQTLALSLSEKAVQLVERNERLAAGGHQLTETTKTASNATPNSNSNANSNNTQSRQSAGGRNDNRRGQQGQGKQR